MKINLVIPLLFRHAIAASRTFTDDLGVKHEIAMDKPKIVTWAHTAVTLSHYGLTDEQLLGTYGEHANSGSDLDFEKPELGSSFPADPTAEEIRFLQSVVNLSPGCGAEYCTEFNQEYLENVKPDLFILHGYRQSPWAIASHVQNITDFMGRPPIYIELSAHGEDCKNENVTSCYGKSMIEIIERYNELAEFLDFDTPSKLDEDYARLCASAETFTKQMKGAQEKGIRTMAAYLTTGTSYFATPVDDMVLRMFEELGMPIMHVGGCTNETTCKYEYFWEYIPIDEYFNSCEEGQNLTDCNANTLYPVDFWLYDHRTTLTVQNEDFATAFPDQAILKKQYASWPIGGRLITPDHASRILDTVGKAMEGAERIYDATACVPDVDVVSLTHRQSHALGGLPGGSYACYGSGEYHNTDYYKGCSDSEADKEADKEVVDKEADKEADKEVVKKVDDEVAGSSESSASSLVMGSLAVFISSFISLFPTL